MKTSHQIGRLVLAIAGFVVLSSVTSAQSFNTLPAGEKLTYQITFDRFPNVGFAELQVVSIGKLDGRDVVELRSKFKTLDLVSAAFFLVDQSRTTFCAPDTGLPIFMTKTRSDSVLPKDTTLNFLRVPAFGYDFPSLIYKARLNNGGGTFPLYENGKLYYVTFFPGKKVHLKTDAGDFDTISTEIESEFFDSHDLGRPTIYFSDDSARIPVEMTFKLRSGLIKISLSAVSRPEAGTVFVNTPGPVPTPAPPTPTPTPGPRPTVTPTPYIDNQPLPMELNFSLGESLDYRVTSTGQPEGIITLSAKERKLVNRRDTLFLSAVVTSVDPNARILNLGDHMQALVDAETLAPRSVESKFNSSFRALNQTLVFDDRTGQVTAGGGTPVDSPLGTHSLLSLLYAMRSFNLTAASIPSASVNDTRVAVFWENKPLIFTLRPGKAESLTINGQKVLTQPVTFTTGDPQLDALALKTWLDVDTRVPLRFTAGTLQADLLKK